jgi:hypothetical protein
MISYSVTATVDGPQEYAPPYPMRQAIQSGADLVEAEIFTRYCGPGLLSMDLGELTLTMSLSKLPFRSWIVYTDARFR